MLTLRFVRRAWSETGGAEHYLNRLAVGLKASGCRVGLVCETWSGHGRKDVFDHVEELGRGLFRPLAPLQFARRVDAFTAGRGEVVFSLERGVRADLFRAGDGVHQGWLARRSRQTPGRGWWRNTFNFKNHVVCHLEARTFDPARTRRVIANSRMVWEDIRHYFPDFPPDRIEIIHNGVDVEKFGSGQRDRGRAELGIGPDETVVLLVGAGRERKGHRQAAEAVAGVPGLRLLIIDRPPPCSMPDLYAAADLFLLPTIYDPFANVTLEAMAAGLPVITTRDNGACDVLRDGENGFVVGTAFEMAEMRARLDALRDADLRRRMGAAARETAKACSLADHIARTLALCQRMAADGPGGG